MTALLEIDLAEDELASLDLSTAPRTLREALAHQEAERLRNQRIRDRYESLQGRHVLVRGRTAPSRPNLPGWLAIHP